MLKLVNKKIIAILRLKKFLILTYLNLLCCSFESIPRVPGEEGVGDGGSNYHRFLE